MRWACSGVRKRSGLSRFRGQRKRQRRFVRGREPVIILELVIITCSGMAMILVKRSRRPWTELRVVVPAAGRPNIPSADASRTTHRARASTRVLCSRSAGPAVDGYTVTR